MGSTAQTIQDFGAMALMGSIAAFLSMTAGVSSLMLSGFIAWRVREDVRTIEDLKIRLKTAEESLENAEYVSDEIANLLYDLFGLFSSIHAVAELHRIGARPGTELFKDIDRQILTTEKHFAELGLFSVDDVRRHSVQQSLASMFGDFATLEIMRKIADGKIGKKDESIKLAYDRLRTRLMRDKRIIVDSYVWTGRPSGGAF